MLKHVCEDVIGALLPDFWPFFLPLTSYITMTKSVDISSAKC